MNFSIKHPSGLRLEIKDDGSIVFGRIGDSRACVIHGDSKKRQGAIHNFNLGFSAHAFHVRVFDIIDKLSFKFVKPFHIFASEKFAKREKHIGEGLR